MSEVKLPTRSELDPQTTWNKESVFASPEDWSAEVAALAAGLEGLAAWQGRLGESPQVLADALSEIESSMVRMGIVYVYASMSEAVDVGNQEATAQAAEAGSLYGRLMGTVAYMDPELLAIGQDTLTRWMAAEPRLAIYAHYLDDLFRRQAHVRSPEVEEVMGAAADAFSGAGGTYSKLTDSDFKFAPATLGQGTAELTQGSIDELLNSPDRETRRTAWENYHDHYLAFGNTLASSLATSIKQNVLTMHVRNYPSTLEMALFRDAIPGEVFHNLLETFKRNHGVWRRYWDVRRRALGLDKIYSYDIWAPLTPTNPKVPYTQAVEWIAESLRPLGDDYVDVLRRGALGDRWVDVYPNEGKTAGAFSSGSRGTHPFILMSYTDDASSMGTLAHELGHSMHSYLSWQNQPPVYSDYSLFAAEVASNFHQAMMRAYLLQQPIGRDLKIAVIEEAMSNFHRYFLIMPTLAMFEWEMHKRVERGQGLTADGMNDYLADLFGEVYGDEMVLDRARDGIRWATFGHLYADYYVFQYATGISGANALAQRVLAGGNSAAEDYLGFLKAGGSRYPLEALKSAGVDLSTPEPVEAAFGVLAGMIDQLDELTNSKA